MSEAMLVADRLTRHFGGLTANLEVCITLERGKLHALLGPNGAGKTTLISVVCGLINASAGTVRVDGHDIVRDYRAARALIGLVPQELTTDAFETVWNTVSFTRGLFGKPPDPAYLERLLKDLSLWSKKDAKLMMLSGGMKRRVLIAKALSHEPRILFLDEPTAGVDVELRRDMWQLVRRLRDSGVTVILTTHYIEEAEEMADRIGVITRGELILVEDKAALMKKLGGKQLTLQLAAPLAVVPPALARYGLVLGKGGQTLMYRYESEREDEDKGERGGGAIADLLQDLAAAGIAFTDLHTTQRSLEEIFVSLVSERTPENGTIAAEGTR
ncbi:MAG: ABC transporter ATP-binding protein [Thauera sp.]|nr:ABC transporter ATP-binding protein [Thauera sp.]